MSRRHDLKNFALDVYIKGEKMDRTETFKLLGVKINDRMSGGITLKRP